MPDQQSAPPPPDKPGFTPSNSTTATALGGTVASLIMMILGHNGVTFPAGMESEIAILAAAIIGYIPSSGRK